MAIKGARELAAELASIRKGKTRPLYLVHGTERYLVRTSAEAISTSLADALGAERITMDAAGQSAEAVLSPVTSLSLFASAQVVLVKNFAHLLTGDSADRLLAGLDTVLGEGNALVFMAGGGAPGEKLDKRVKGYKGLVKRAAVVELNTQKPEDLMLWLKEKAREGGKTLDADAAQLLLSRTGTDMETLRMELDKAVLYHLDQDRITSATLARLVGKTREDAVWDVSERIERGDAAGALHMLADLFDTGTYPLVVLTLLVRQTRHRLQARFLWERAGQPPFSDARSFPGRVRLEKGAFGGGPDDVTTIHPYRTFLSFEAARGSEVPELRRILSRLRRADLEAKTGAGAGARETVEEVVLDLCASAVPGRSAA